MSTYFKTQSTLTLKQQVFGSYEAANWLKDNTNGRAVLISRSLSEPQIFLAFSHRWDPKSYQDATKSWKFDTSGATWVDQLPSYSLGNYTVKSIDWKTDVNSGSILVSKADEYKGSQIPIKTFNYPDGTPNIYVIDTNQKIYAKVL